MRLESCTRPGSARVSKPAFRLQDQAQIPSLIEQIELQTGRARDANRFGYFAGWCRRRCGPAIPGRSPAAAVLQGAGKAAVGSIAEPSRRLAEGDPTIILGKHSKRQVCELKPNFAGGEKAGIFGGCPPFSFQIGTSSCIPEHCLRQRK